jgi:hypothetical protein
MSPSLAIPATKHPRLKFFLMAVSDIHLQRLQRTTAEFSVPYYLPLPTSRHVHLYRSLGFLGASCYALSETPFENLRFPSFSGLLHNAGTSKT